MLNYFKYLASMVVIVMLTVVSIGKYEISSSSFIVILYIKADCLPYFMSTTTRI